MGRSICMTGSRPRSGLRGIAAFASVKFMSDERIITSATEFDQAAEDATAGPVGVATRDHREFVLMSKQAFAALRGEAWAQLDATMARLAAQAAASGLTEAKLDELLADES